MSSHSHSDGNTPWRALLCGGFLFLMSLGAVGGRVDAAHTPGRVFLLIVDRVTWDDLNQSVERHTTLRQVVQGGAVAGLNTQTARGLSTPLAAVTLSAGGKADAYDDAGEVYNTSEAADLEAGAGGEVYTRRTGLDVGDHQVVATKIVSIHRCTASFDKGVVPGYLGTRLEELGLKTATFGCSDLSPTGKTLWQYRVPGEATQWGAITRYRSAALIAMDRHGRVDYGDVGASVLRHDTRAAFGCATDVPALLSRMDTVLRRSALFLVVVDSGDGFRADECSLWTQPSVVTRHRRQAVANMERLLQGIGNRMDPRRDRLLLLPLSPPKNGPHELCPLVVYGKGIEPGSLLMSSTTRRAGVVTLPDVTASLLAFAGCSAATTPQGHPMQTVKPRVSSPIGGRSGEANLAHWRQVGRVIHDGFVLDTRLRNQSLMGLALLEALVLLWAFAHTLTSPTRSLPALLSSLMLAALALPLLLFWLTPTLLSMETGWQRLGVPLGGALGVGLLLNLVTRNPRIPILLLGGATAASVAFDLLTGSRVSFNSIVGYSPFYGGRYYGLGNVGMAVFWGATMGAVAAAFAGGKGNGRTVPVGNAAWMAAAGGFLVILALIGLPRYGADIGGTLAAGVGFGVALLRLKGIAVRSRHWLSLGIGVVLVVALYAWVDLRSASSQSHLGRLITTAHSQGLDAVSGMVIRKLLILGRSFRHWHWDTSLAVVLLLTAYLPKMRREGRLPVLDEAPAFTACLAGLLSGSIAAFLLNDSGPVVPSLAAIYGYAGLFYLNRR